MFPILFFLITLLFFTLCAGALLLMIFRRQLAILSRAEGYLDLDLSIKRKTKKDKADKINKLVIIKKISDGLKSLIDRLIPATSRINLEQRLREAGYPFNLSPTDFRLLQGIIGMVVFAFFFMLVSKADTSTFSSLLLAGVISLLAMYYPSFYVSTIIKKRRYEVQKTMADFFDMVNLSIEAGMGLDASLQRVCHQTKGALSDEFLQTLEDMKLGKSRREAFADLRDRVPVYQFQSIITSLIQADMLGVGMANVIRTVTARIREQRRQFAREQAMKAPVKMVFPMLLFIFPAIFIVMLGPLVIYLLQNVFNGR